MISIDNIAFIDTQTIFFKCDICGTFSKDFEGFCSVCSDYQDELNACFERDWSRW